MLGLLQALSVAKGAIAVAVLTIVTAFAGVSTGAAPGNHPAPPSQAAPHQSLTVVDRLDANRAQLLKQLQDVLAHLESIGANDHAIAAIQKRIDAIEAGQDGLTTAANAVAGNPPAGDPPAARPPLPSQGVNPPNPPAPNPPGPPAPPSHPSSTDHPSATNHPGRP